MQPRYLSSSLQQHHWLLLLIASLLLFFNNTIVFWKQSFAHMGSRVVQCFTIFFLHLFIAAGASVAEPPPPSEAIQKNKLLVDQENTMLFTSSMSPVELDEIPIINPTTPGTTTPVVTSPAPPTTTTPTPTTPTPTPTTVTPPAVATPTTSGGSWCVASAAASETALQVALDYACGYGGADCTAIQPAGSCYNPNTLKDHASYAFNDYYQKNPIPTSCVFGGTAQLTSTDPSNGNCHYASPKTTPSITPPTTTTPTTMIPTTMSPPSPTTMTTPGGPTVYGVAEPTGLPSSATSVSCSLVLLLSATGVVESLFAASHF